MSEKSNVSKMVSEFVFMLMKHDTYIFSLDFLIKNNTMVSTLWSLLPRSGVYKPVRCRVPLLALTGLLPCDAQPVNEGSLGLL